MSATKSALFIDTIKLVAFGRHHKRGGAAFGRAISFVASFVEAVNIVNIVAVKTVARESPWDSLERTDSKLT